MAKTAICAEKAEPDSNTADRFARAPYFIIFDESDDSYTVHENLMNQAHGAGPKAVETLLEMEISAAVGPQLGENAVRAAKAGGLEIYMQENGTVLENYQMYKEGKLKKM